MPEPQNKADLQRFLGMVAYLSKFIPNLSDETLILRQLITKNACWQFDENHSKQFKRIKELIMNDMLLKFFDPNLPTKVACDSSKTGLGATLKQQINGQWHPIAFKSRVTSAAEQNYCPLERETLAIVFGCSKFHEYIYGKKFIVQSDHKPLKNIFNNPICKAPPRIQSFMMFLQKYDLTLITHQENPRKWCVLIHSAELQSKTNLGMKFLSQKLTPKFITLLKLFQ